MALLVACIGLALLSLKHGFSVELGQLFYLSAAIIFALFFSATVSYLWFPLIGCTICVILSIVLQKYFDRKIDNGDTNQLANKETIS